MLCKGLAVCSNFSNTSRPFTRITMSELFILHPKEKALIHGTYLEIGKIVAILGDSRL